MRIEIAYLLYYLQFHTPVTIVMTVTLILASIAWTLNPSAVTQFMSLSIATQYADVHSSTWISLKILSHCTCTSFHNTECWCSFLQLICVSLKILFHYTSTLLHLSWMQNLVQRAPIFLFWKHSSWLSKHEQWFVKSEKWSWQLLA